MRSRNEIQEFAGVMFMLGQIETKADVDWANDFAVSIRNYIVGLFNDGIEEKPIKSFDESADEPTGEWIRSVVDFTDGSHAYHYHCSNCNEEVFVESNYCPNCGAKMGGDAK